MKIWHRLLNSLSYNEVAKEQREREQRQLIATSAAHQAATESVHYYFAFRDLDWWRKAIDEAEKSGEKYLAFAQLVTKIKKENEK